jgi:peptide/nickel transport system substrate-binding protein/oligopeptide transport system substrate-binding protein
MGKSKVSRREFIRFAGITGGAALLTACAPQVVTQVVNQTQVVEQTQIVNQTQIVEVDVPVTVTPPPQITTPQGRVLPPDAAPLEKQIFRQMAGEPKHFDTARDIYSSGATNLGNEPLLRNNENIETVPALAESWTAGPNAEYWDFVIREGAMWSDGEPITADDVVYTYRHLADPAMANPWIWFYGDIKGISAFNQGTGTADDIGVEKLDDRTVRIHGEFGSIPYLPALLSYQAVVVVPQHVAEADPEGWANSIETFVSGGPYIPTTWQHNQLLEWDINPMYNGPHKPAIQKVINPILAAGAAEFTPFLNKESDLVHVLNPQDLAAARADPKLSPLIHFFNNFQSTYIALDTFQAPLDNLDFRKALAHAIDRDTLAQQVLNGTYVAGYSMLPPGFPAYNPELKVHQEYNLDEAMAALEASGIDPASATIELYANAASGVEAQILQFVQQQWQTNLGITVNLNVLEAGVWGQNRADHAMQAYRGPYEYDYVDPSNMLTGLFRSQPAPEGKEEPWGSPRHPWISTEFDELVTAAGSEADVETRLGLYQQAEEILASDVGVIFLAHQVVFQIWWPWLVGMAPNSEGNVVFRWLDISRFQMYIHQNVDELKASY